MANAVREFSLSGDLVNAEKFIMPMWLFFWAFVINIFTLTLLAVFELRKSND